MRRSASSSTARPRRAEAKGSWLYFLWWLAAFAIKAGLSIIFGESSRVSLSQVGIVAPLFFLLATRSAYLCWGATRMGLQVR